MLDSTNARFTSRVASPWRTLLLVDDAHCANASTSAARCASAHPSRPGAASVLQASRNAVCWLAGSWGGAQAVASAAPSELGGASGVTVPADAASCAAPEGLSTSRRARSSAGKSCAAGHASICCTSATSSALTPLPPPLLLLPGVGATLCVQPASESKFGEGPDDAAIAAPLPPHTHSKTISAAPHLDSSPSSAPPSASTASGRGCACSRPAAATAPESSWILRRIASRAGAAS